MNKGLLMALSLAALPFLLSACGPAALMASAIAPAQYRVSTAIGTATFGDASQAEAIQAVASAMTAAGMKIAETHPSQGRLSGFGSEGYRQTWTNPGIRAFARERDGQMEVRIIAEVEDVSVDEAAPRRAVMAICGQLASQVVGASCAVTSDEARTVKASGVR